MDHIIWGKSPFCLHVSHCDTKHIDRYKVKNLLICDLDIVKGNVKICVQSFDTKQFNFHML
jgi:hypothetical protein